MYAKYSLGLLLSCTWAFQSVLAQTARSLSLDSCLVWAEQNYPQIKQYKLLNKSTGYSLQNAQKGKLPQFSISGQATYQSEVTSLPGGEGMGAPELSKDQYQLYGEVVQPLTDIGIINQQKRIIQANAEIDHNDLKVRIYQIKERVSDLFFGILLMDGQLKQIELTKADLNAGINRVDASIKYGTALKSNGDILRAELITIEQRAIELAASRKGYLKMLELFIDQPLGESVTIEAPEINVLSSEIARPELSLFNARLRSITLQSDLLDKNNQPKFNIFFQGGLGRPALNFLSNDFEPYYIGGLRLSWNLSNFYTSSREKQIYALNQGIVKSEQETFLFNTNLTLTNLNSELTKLEELIVKDKQIIDLRERIMETSKNQLEHGVITSTDYKAVVIDTDQARQNLALHEIELLKMKNEHKLTTGN